jgi:hypothetical protein
MYNTYISGLRAYGGPSVWSLIGYINAINIPPEEINSATLEAHCVRKWGGKLHKNLIYIYIYIYFEKFIIFG